MGAIWHALVQSYAFIATVPVIPFLLVYFVGARGGDRKAAVRLAMDVTTIFLIGFVAGALNTRLHSNFSLYFILLVMLVGGGLIGNAQNRLRGKVDAGKLFRAVWRLSFFCLVPVYLLLMLLEIVFPAKSA
ncbi:DUF3397 domain-containing protein [Cohnella suwonensis]|uniref:DUF3397 domain-containing protein n=1 Tax=Cohnella suwonensis TaxID=696072 RepID=A0ABW0LR40_9BACL